MREKRISEAVVRRLPKYYACLKKLAEEGTEKVNSTALAALLRCTASQVRQDLSNFGGFGQQGYGYDVAFLRDRIRAILGLDREQGVIIIGGGRIGQALASYEGFADEGFRVLAVFDVDVSSIRVRPGVRVAHISELPDFVRDNDVEIAVIATQADAAAGAAERVTGLGIRAVWNFAPCDLKAEEGVAVENINMSESLFMLSYKYKNLSKEKGKNG